MLKRIKDYIPGFSDIYYINEYGDVYQVMPKEDLKNGSYVWRCSGVSYSVLVRYCLHYLGRGNETTPQGKSPNKSLKHKINIYDCGEFLRVVGEGKECLFHKKDNVFLANRRKVPQKRGYKYLGTQPDRYSIHHIVYKCFIGEIPDDRIIHHIDENKVNNWYKNLVALTREEHIRIHKYNL